MSKVNGDLESQGANWVEGLKKQNFDLLYQSLAEGLVSVQYRAVRAITGAFRATTRVTLNIEAHALLIDLRLNKLIIDVALRIATSSSYNSIIEIKSKKKEIKVISSLKRLTNKLTKHTKVSIDNFECITLYSTSSWWISSTISIKLNKEAIENAHKAHIHKSNKLFIYIDDNDINDKVEATTISLDQSLQRYLKLLIFFTIYLAKLLSILITLIMIIHRTLAIKEKLVICIDNQAIIQTIINSRINSRQSIIKVIIYKINHIRKLKKVDIKFHWISTHMNIVDNETTNVTVKKVTR